MVRFVQALVAAPLLGALALNAAALPARADAARTIEVRYSDLNLSTAEGRKSLQSRVRRAAKTVCGGQPTVGSLGEMIAFDKCFTSAMAGSNAQIAARTAPVLAAR